MTNSITLGMNSQGIGESHVGGQVLQSDESIFSILERWLSLIQKAPDAKGYAARGDKILLSLTDAQKRAYDNMMQALMQKTQLADADKEKINCNCVFKALTGSQPPAGFSALSNLAKYDALIRLIVQSQKCGKQFAAVIVRSLDIEGKKFKKRGGGQDKCYHTFFDRYSDILPYEHTRVTTQARIPYINASAMRLLKSPCIAAQGPKSTTCSQFFSMIMEQQAKCLVALGNPHKIGRNFCLFEKYFDYASPIKPDSPHVIGSWDDEYTLSTKKREEVIAKCLGQNVTKMDVTLKHSYVDGSDDEDVDEELTEKIHTFTLFQYLGWPDHGAPNGTLFAKLTEEVCKAQGNSDKPVIAHCSAGVGRTGTFLGAYAAKRLQGRLGKLPSDVTAPSLIFAMRMHRTQMVQSAGQFKALETYLDALR